MKKLSFILGVMIVIAFSSCSKEKDCSCVSTVTGMAPVTQVMTIEDGECSDMNTTTTLIGMTSTTTCTEQ